MRDRVRSAFARGVFRGLEAEPRSMAAAVHLTHASVVFSAQKTQRSNAKLQKGHSRLGVGLKAAYLPAANREPQPQTQSPKS